jgi:hypothetical protein
VTSAVVWVPLAPSVRSAPRGLADRSPNTDATVNLGKVLTPPAAEDRATVPLLGDASEHLAPVDWTMTIEVSVW